MTRVGPAAIEDAADNWAEFLKSCPHLLPFFQLGTSMHWATAGAKMPSDELLVRIVDHSLGEYVNLAGPPVKAEVLGPATFCSGRGFEISPSSCAVRRSARGERSAKAIQDPRSPLPRFQTGQLESCAARDAVDGRSCRLDAPTRAL